MISSKNNKLFNLLEEKAKINKTTLKDAFMTKIFLVLEKGPGTRVLLDRFLNEIGLEAIFTRKEMT